MAQNLFALIFACFVVVAYSQDCAWDDEQSQECGGNWKKPAKCCKDHVCGNWKTCVMVRDPTPPTPAAVAYSQDCAWDDEQAQECGGNWKKPAKCCKDHVCGTWKTCVMVREPTPPTPAASPVLGSCPTGDLRISCIKWLTTGGRGQHLHAIVAVEDDNGPVIGADVTMSLTRNGKEFKQPTVTTSGASQASLSTYPDLAQCPYGSAGITPDQCVNSAIPAEYMANVLMIAVEGCDNQYADNLYEDNWVQFPGPIKKG